MFSLDNRARAVASFVRNGSLAADIGADHALIPIYLVKNGICPRAVASDINEGPAERARKNIAKYLLSDKIDVVVADGLDGAERYNPDDIIIAGMGGELIISILCRTDYVINPSVRLILQPMTKVPLLREYLYFSGYNIVGEALARASGKIYQIIATEYDGIKRSLSPAEAELGKINISDRAPLFGEFAKSRLASLEKQRDGMHRANLPTEDEDALISEIKELIDK